MSWLARSFANSLLIDDDPRPTSSNANQDHTQEQVQGSEIDIEDRTGGVKEDLSEFTESLTRQLWGFASFLAPPPPPSHGFSTMTSQADPSVSDHDPYFSDDDHASSSAYDHLRFGAEHRVSDLLSLPINDRTENMEAVGVTEEALAFARNISHHPETWLDFPLLEEEDDDDFEMSDTQWNHVTLVELLAPRLAALRIELCPIHMSESYFWKVYFVLLHPRLNKHDADLLSTPQIVAARTIWMKELQKRTIPEPEPELSERNTSHAFDGSDSLHEDFSTTSSDFPCANTSERTSLAFDTGREKYPLVRSEKSVTQEEGLDQRIAPSYMTPTEDDDDWIHENSELDGYDGPDVLIGTDEDISFSDLEADDDCTMPIRSKII